MRYALLALVLITAPACAQPAETPDEVMPTQHVALTDTSSQDGPDDPTLLGRATEWTETEEAVHAMLNEGEGLHVVHFWAPWCGNSNAEFRAGWYEVIETNPDVAFTFVTVWSDGVEGRDVLERYGIPETVTVLAQPDRGRSADKENRRRTFMDLPLTWTPTTWVFRDGGTLAYAFNYGEVRTEQLQTAIDDAQLDWEHD